jgi:SAM-dependent methyltransferase
MKTKMLSTMAIVAMMWGAGAAPDSLAQTPNETPMEHARPGHQMSRPSDGAFHHSFEDADKWAKEFDNPERDAWQKPDEILDALCLRRTSFVADIGAGTGYFSVRIAKLVPEGKIFAADIEPDMVRYLGERARRVSLCAGPPR